MPEKELQMLHTNKEDESIREINTMISAQLYTTVTVDQFCSGQYNTVPGKEKVCRI